MSYQLINYLSISPTRPWYSPSATANGVGMARYWNRISPSPISVSTNSTVAQYLSVCRRTDQPIGRASIETRYGRQRLPICAANANIKKPLLAELPRGDWAQTVLKEFFTASTSTCYSNVYRKAPTARLRPLQSNRLRSYLSPALEQNGSSAWAMAQKSHQRMLNALEEVWPYTGEMFMPAEYELATGDAGTTLPHRKTTGRISKRSICRSYACCSCRQYLHAFRRQKRAAYGTHGLFVIGPAIHATCLSQRILVSMTSPEHIIKPTNTEESKIWELLEQVTDPEIPVLSILDMGIVHEVRVSGKEAEVVITPTYSGCPAMDMIAMNIRIHPMQHGYEKCDRISVLSPVWRPTAWPNPEKKKLQQFGIALPQELSTRANKLLFSDEIAVNVPCCHSTDTRLLSQSDQPPAKPCTNVILQRTIRLFQIAINILTFNSITHSAWISVFTWEEAAQVSVALYSGAVIGLEREFRSKACRFPNNDPHLRRGHAWYNPV